jgi:8-oxo-dGTP pyrophosphatase MutT (NUDIX family)
MARLKSVKHSVAVLIEDPQCEEGSILAVKRPSDDSELPGIWGLPAATLRAGESWEDAVRRVGSEKLGIDLEPSEELHEGTQERPGYLLHMKLYRGRIGRGSPRLRRVGGHVTQYTDWKWAEPDELEEGAFQGSLCCKLVLASPA